MTLYSWRDDRKAGRKTIRHFIAEAVDRKAWAATMPDDWQASEMSRQMLAEVRGSTIHQLARKAMEYARHRAFLRSGGEGSHSPNGWPIDKLAADLWASLRGEP